MTGHVVLDRLHPKARRLIDAQLEADETIVAVVPGRARQAMIVTDQRVVLVKPGLMAGLWVGPKVGLFELPQILAVNVHTGRGIAALELVIAGSATASRPDLTTAFQTPNWLPCQTSVTGSSLIGALRAYVESDGRSDAARDELAVAAGA